MQQNHAIWLGALILLAIIIILLLIWMFSSPPKNGVIIVKKDTSTSTNVASKNLISTPVVEGVVVKSDEYEADETIYSPQNTEVLTDGTDMSKYSPVEDEVYLTPPLSQE